MTTDTMPGGRPLPPLIRLVPPDRPWSWVAAGWRDLMAAPPIGFFYGGMLTAAGWLLVLLLLKLGAAWAILPATSGFFLVAPLLGAGLYETSRRLEAGEPVSLASAFSGFSRNAPQLALIGIALLLLHLFWVRIAGLLFAVFFGLGFAPPIEDLPFALLRSDQLLPFLITGTLSGMVLAAAAFSLAAVSIPMLLDRDVTAAEAMITSVRTVASNWRAMSYWAGLIVVLTAMALVPFFLGLALMLPVIGHATWHAYRDLVR